MNSANGADDDTCNEKHGEDTPWPQLNAVNPADGPASLRVR
jgi:hypothetical protein